MNQYRDLAANLAPKIIFDLAQTDPVVHTILEYWLEGRVTWEQALISMVQALSEKTTILEKESIKNLRESVK